MTDVAPAQSPVAIGGLLPGTSLSFDATGRVGNCDGLYDNGFGCRVYGPDGGIFGSGAPWFHDTGAQNGISDVGSPINALIAVFLDDSVPNDSAAPGRLDFNSLASRDYLTLSPGLKQIFFIGNGVNGDGVAQQIIVPTGATRLFLGTMDGCCWNNNSGQFVVQITASSDLHLDPRPGPPPTTIPEPVNLSTALVGLAAVAILHINRMR